jgi:hypothetical protein
LSLTRENNCRWTRLRGFLQTIPHVARRVCFSTPSNIPTILFTFALDCSPHVRYNPLVARPPPPSASRGAAPGVSRSDTQRRWPMLPIPPSRASSARILRSLSPVRNVAQVYVFDPLHSHLHTATTTYRRKTYDQSSSKSRPRRAHPATPCNPKQHATIDFPTSPQPQPPTLPQLAPAKPPRPTPTALAHIRLRTIEHFCTDLGASHFFPLLPALPIPLTTSTYRHHPARHTPLALNPIRLRDISPPSLLPPSSISYPPFATWPVNWSLP